MKKPSKIVELNSNLALEKSARKVPSLKNSLRLSRHEKQIEKNLATKSKISAACDFEIGKELYQIHFEGDYTDASFEAYVKRRWEKTRQWGYNLIDAYKIKSELPESVNSCLQTESQARALKAAPEEQREEILKEVKSSGPVTAKTISEQIKKSRIADAEFVAIERKDCDGTPIPEHLYNEFDKWNQISKDIRLWVNGLRSELKDGTPFGALPKQEKTMLGDIYANSNLRLCDCGGTGCAACGNIGLITASQWQ